VRVGVSVLLATPRNFEAQRKTAEMPSRLIYQHGNEINIEQFTTSVDRVLRSWYVRVGYSAWISEVFNVSDLYILLTVHLVIIFVNNQLDAKFFFLNEFISILYMFRAALCSSSGESIVSILHPNVHTRRSPKQSGIYQMSYWYNRLSWWWAQGCSKHIENWNKLRKRIVRQVGYLQELMHPSSSPRDRDR